MSEPKQLRMTDHAAMRWLERGGPVETMNAEIDAAIKYGAQRGDDQLWLTPCGLVLAATGDGVVKTVLTQSLAVANMQAGGMSVHTLPTAPVLPQALSRKAARELRRSIEMAENESRRDEELQQRLEDMHARRERTIAEVAVEVVLESGESGRAVRKLTRARLAAVGYVLTPQDEHFVFHAVQAAELMKKVMTERTSECAQS